MSFLLGLLISLSAAAQSSWIEAPIDHIPILQKANSESRVLYYTNEGERLGVLQSGRGFVKVKVYRNGKWRLGYIYAKDLQPGGRNESPVKGLGILAGPLFTYLQQGAKSFTTEDQVNYTTDAFTSTALSFAVGVQMGRKDFWRALLAYRQTDYSSEARTDVAGAPARDVVVQHQMISGTFQKLWTSRSGWIYYGAGVELSKAIGATVKIGGVDVPTGDESLPMYMGLQGILGFQFKLSRKLSMFIEVRPIAYPNQDPMVMGTEAAAALIFWP